MLEDAPSIRMVAATHRRRSLSRQGPACSGRRDVRCRSARAFDLSAGPRRSLAPGTECRGFKWPAWTGSPRLADASALVTTVCTGSALLARTGRLDGIAATSNKAAFAWVMEQGPKVDWKPEARWVEDGKFMTSSGVSAGMDMALAVDPAPLWRRRGGASGRDAYRVRLETRSPPGTRSPRSMGWFEGGGPVLR